MTTMYAVFKEGVYRHDCYGIFTSEDAARDAAKRAAEAEPDDYHGFAVVPFEVDKFYDTDAEPAEITRYEGKPRYVQRLEAQQDTRPKTLQDLEKK